MTVAIDTNILLDILLDDPTFYETSKTLLETYDQQALIISPLVYAELLTQFIKKFGQSAEEQLNQFLKDIHISVREFTIKDMTVSAYAWHKFTRQKNIILCPACGHKHTFNCNKCKRIIFWRTHILTDFLIGAHAQNHAEMLLTRDRGFYKKYCKIKVVGCL